MVRRDSTGGERGGFLLAELEPGNPPVGRPGHHPVPQDQTWWWTSAGVSGPTENPAAMACRRLCAAEPDRRSWDYALVRAGADGHTGLTDAPAARLGLW